MIEALCVFVGAGLGFALCTVLTANSLRTARDRGSRYLDELLETQRKNIRLENEIERLKK